MSTDVIARIAAGACVVVALAACSSPATEAQGAAARLHKDPRGFEVRLPAGWKVQPDPKTARIDLVAPAGGRAIVWPLYMSGTAQADAPILRHLAERIWPQTAWSAAPSAGAPVLRGVRGADRVTAMLTASRGSEGTAFVLYAIDAPTAQFDIVGREALVVFPSVRLTGPGETAAAAQPSLEFTTWTDPRERAFTVDVPRGWHAQGGAFRAAPVDVRPAVELRSPDGEIVVRLGDPELPTFIEPIAGFPEGSVYSPYGSPMLARRLVTPSAFLADYVQTRASRGCGALAMLDRRDRPDAVQAVNAVYQRYLPLARLGAAEIAFTCGDRTGYYFAGLQTIRMGGPAMWKAEYLIGFISAKARATEAAAVMTRLMDSFTINPQWLAMQGGVATETSVIVSQAGDAISKTVSDSYWSKQSVESVISRHRSNAMLGIEDVKDEFGNTYRVESGANHYWINPRGRIAGTNTDAVPRADFKPLTIY